MLTARIQHHFLEKIHCSQIFFFFFLSEHKIENEGGGAFINVKIAARNASRFSNDRALKHSSPDVDACFSVNFLMFARASGMWAVTKRNVRALLKHSFLSLEKVGMAQEASMQLPGG